jgi:hypothetical protein
MTFSFVEAEAMIALPDNAASAVTIPKLGDVRLAMVLDYDIGRMRQKSLAKDDIHQIAIGLPAVGRIQKHDICPESLAGEGAQGCEHVLLKDPVSAFHAAEIKVLPYQPVPRRRVLDKHRLPGTPAESLDPDGARAAEHIEHDGASDMRAKNVE